MEEGRVRYARVAFNLIAAGDSDEVRNYPRLSHHPTSFLRHLAKQCDPSAKVSGWMQLRLLPRHRSREERKFPSSFARHPSSIYVNIRIVSRASLNTAI